MCKKLIYFVAFILILGYGDIAIGQLVGVDDPSDMADSSGDIKRIEAWVEDGKLNLTMTVYGVFAPSVDDTPAGMTNRYYYHWLLDTDTDPATGFNNSEYEGNATNLQTPIGVDLVVQFGWRDGNTNGVYAYDPLTEVSLFEDYEYTIEGDTIHAVIPLADLGLTPDDIIAVSAFQEGASNDWQVDWIESFELTLTAVEENVIFLFDDFETYPVDAVLSGLGWTILDTPAAIEASTWTITNPGGRGNPATLDGSASTGQFLISDSDQQSASNPVDSGASHDITTPSFSTLGTTTVWLHADVSAQLNNNGAAIFDVEVSTDGGVTWTNVFSRVAPGRVSSEGATTRLPDNTNADGYFGRLDVDLSGVAANQADVQVRFRHFEPNWDWWIAIDNVLIDNVPAPQGGPIKVFSEDFSDGLGQMIVFSGQGNTGTETWHTTDKGGRYVPGTVQERGVNRLGPHPGPTPDFAIIDSDADPDPIEDEWLMTPSLDLSGMANVFLHYESETVMSGVLNQEVLVSLDGGSTFEATPIFAYTGGGLFDGGEEPVYAKRIFDVSAIAAGESQVVFAFRYTGNGDDWWWAIDNVEVSGEPLPEPVDPGADGLLAYYALDGDANDSSGNGNDGTIYNADTGGLGDGGSVWVDDPERGMVISFNGTASGAYVRAGEIPQMTLTNDFTWSFWAKHSEENTADNDIILGNRMDENAVDFVPRQFIKFTPTKFEWHMNGNGDDNLDYEDIPGDVWLHHAVVKSADQLTYYRNGVEHSSGVFTQPLDFPQPLFFGGDNEGSAGENWSGLMDDVGIYDRALSAGEVRYLAGKRLMDDLLGPDVTGLGDIVQGVPNDGDWPGAETPDLAVDDDVTTKYLHFKGDFEPDPGTGGSGLQITPLSGASIVTGLTLTTANDVPGRDPIAFELSGSNDSIDGPYTLIASGDIVDFAQEEEWPRFTMNATPITFDNNVAYLHYQLIFTAIRGPVGGSVNSMQIAEIELRSAK